jgi:hypothetical protein
MGGNPPIPLIGGLNMANKTTLNPIVLDTFSADVTLKVTGVGAMTIKKILLYSASDGDRFALEDEDGNPIAILVNTGASDAVELDFGDGHAFTNGVVFDYDDALQNGLSSGDYVLIYLK